MSTKVKGAVLLARRAMVLDELGEEGWTRILDLLEPEHRDRLGGLVLSTQWVPFAVNDALDQAIVEVLGGGDRELFKRIGARSARENLGGPHSHFVSPGDPAAFMKRTERIYKFYYDEGYRDFEPTSDTSGVMTTYGAGTFSATDCLTVIGWYEEALGMCGAAAVEIVEEECRAEGASRCRYRVSWG